MTSPKIPEGLQAFLCHADSLHPSNNARRENGFAKEFQQLKDMSSKLKRNPEYTTHHGELDYNRPKNRYKDILPFDRNRVIIPTLPGILGSDYINGNYVKGPDGKTAYLALQGPLPRTVDDFWRLIASHRCQIVIMVCREIEMGKLKCKRYWPESKDEKLSFAGLEISLISQDDIAEGFVMRTMNMKSAREEMTVTQLQYTAWPDHDVPRSAAPLIELNKTLRAVQGNREQNLLIHCSAGCGRTGTICAVDYAWTLLKTQKTNNFSVYDIVADLRRQRMAMVQTKEQYALVYKAVVQLVQEELDKEKLKSHTYVNVEIPSTAPQSQSGHGDYENCEFVKSVSRWKQSDLQNGSVPKASMPLPAPKEAKTNTKPQPRPANRLPMPSSKSEGAAVIKSNAPTKNNYVNLEFTPEVTENKPVSPVKEVDVPKLAQPLSPPRGNTPSLNLNVVKGDRHSPVGGTVGVKPKSPPTHVDYEVLPKKTSGSTVSRLGNEMAPQRNKGLSADYEFPAMSAAGVDKKQSKQHVPEGVLIDLGDDVPPLPSKRHSVGSVTKDGVGSRYENVEVKPSGFSSHRSASSPNVLDDSWLFNSSCLHPTVDNLPQGVPPGNVKEHAESRGFHTLPNRMHPDSGPKRCPLTAEAFQEPGASGGGGGGGGLGVMHSTPGQYYLVGAVNPPSQSPPKTMVNPQVVPQPNQGSQLQKQRPAAPQPKRQGDQPKPRTPVGAYSLVGIPEAGGPILHAPSPVSTPATVKSENSKESTGVPVEVKVMSITGLPAESKGKPTTGGPVEVKGKLNASVPVEVKGKPNAGVPVEVKGKSTTGIPVEVKGKPNAGVPVEIKGKPNTGVPVEVKGKPIAEPSYELVGQWQQAGKKVSPPSVQPYKPRNVGSPDGTTGANREPHSSQLLLHNVDKQNAVAKSKSTPDISLRSQGDGEPQTVNDVTVAPDVYATVAQRTRDKTESQDRNSSNLSTGSPNLRTQSSSGSLRSFTSTSSDEGDSPPAVPQKTNEAFLVPGEEPYEAVQQTNKGTLDRFKKMMKSGSKGSLPKRLSDVTLPLGLPRTNSSGTATVRWEEKGYKKRFPKPAGPRPCPANWPSCVHLGL